MGRFVVDSLQNELCATSSGALDLELEHLKLCFWPLLHAGKLYIQNI